MYGPDVAILFIYGSHDVRHIGFPQVDGGQRDLREMGRHIFVGNLLLIISCLHHIPSI